MQSLPEWIVVRLENREGWSNRCRRFCWSIWQSEMTPRHIDDSNTWGVLSKKKVIFLQIFRFSWQILVVNHCFELLYFSENHSFFSDVPLIPSRGYNIFKKVQNVSFHDFHEKYSLESIVAKGKSTISFFENKLKMMILRWGIFEIRTKDVQFCNFRLTNAS